MSIKLFTAGKAAEYLGIHPHTLKLYADQAIFVPYAVSDKGRRMYTQAQLDSWKKIIDEGIRISSRTTPDGMITIRMFSVRTGIPVSTLRQWDKNGILSAAGRGGNGVRLYTIEQLETTLKDLRFDTDTEEG